MPGWLNPQKTPVILLLSGCRCREPPTPGPTPYLSLGSGLGSGRTAMERGVCREGDVKLRSKEPAFLCSGSAPRAPCISASTGQEPARPWRDREHTSGPTAPWSTASAGSWGSWVGEVDGGERDFLLVDAPASSFRSPLFLSFWGDTRTEANALMLLDAPEVGEGQWGPLGSCNTPAKLLGGGDRRPRASRSFPSSP